jgi:hypothetical protein
MEAARSIPSRPNKAERLIEFMRRCAEQEAFPREMLKPDAALLREWWNIGRLAF